MAISAVTTTAASQQEEETNRFGLELEAGGFAFNRDDVRIPGNTGTEFDMTSLTGDGPEPYLRLNGDCDINARHGLRLVIAPLEVKGTGNLSQPTRFAGQVFAPGATQGTYKFNVYKLTYRYTFYNKSDWRWRLDFTGLIRDANIELQQGSKKANDDNVGFAPLIHLYGEYRFPPKWKFTFDFDGLASSQGRARDMAFKLSYDLTPDWTLGGGYRTLEGGIDNDDVYNFAWLNYGFVSLRYRF